jgi:5-(carboxyamino)imidazole ribonucleotide mutase
VLGDVLDEVLYRGSARRGARLSGRRIVTGPPEYCLLTTEYSHFLRRRNMHPIQVGILMGSDSDLPIMRDAAQVLAELGIGVDMHVMSAHRTPDDAAQYARTAADRGLSILIAGAGGAAHLPGVLAAYTALPVIGVPIASSMATLGGMDALLAIVQMPPGVPVATVAINGARNAGLLAAQILALADQALAARLAAQRQSMADNVRAKDQALPR